jgi:MFS family permease
VPGFTVRSVVDHAEVERLLRPRDDVVAERSVAPEPGETARFALDHGPFATYERTVTLSPVDTPVETPVDTPVGTPVDARGDRDREVRAGRPDEPPGARTEAVERVRFTLPPGTWPFLINWPMRSALRHPRSDGRLPWWYPPQRPDARGATVLGLLATLSLVVGYHGTLLSRTMTFAADEFGAGSAAQGDALAAARIGGVLAIGLGALADRRGRRLILSLALFTCIGSTVVGAFAPNLATLAGTQAVNRGAWAAAALLLAVIAAEEMPAGARAYALSLLAMTGALGAGIALWVLPIADLGERAWRVLYVVPLVFVPVVIRFGRLIPESRRFARTHRNVPLAGHYRRLLLVAAIWLLYNVFSGPQSQFLNEYLRDERGMSAAMISLFVVITSTPASIGIVVGGRVADTRGRRVVGAVAAAVGAALIALSFVVSGPAMWVTALLGGIVAAAMVPALAVYGPELFPTSLRGRANGIVSMTAMGGSVIGLVAAGRLEESLGSFGRTMSLLAVAPVLMALLVLLFFPETARRELEEINPEDDLAGQADRSGEAGRGGRPERAAAVVGNSPPPAPVEDARAPVSGDPDEVGSAAPG